MGGIGKTRLAAEYCYRQDKAGAYPDGIFWIDAARGMALGFGRLARELGLAVADEPLESQVRKAFDELQERKAALVVLDNLNDLASLNRPTVPGCIPSNLRCRLLFTTRSRDLGDFKSVEVTALEEPLALELLLRRRNRLAVKPKSHHDHDDHESAVAITQTLGCLPLALELAGAYLGKWSDPDKPGYVELADYLKRLETQGGLATVSSDAKKLSENDLQSIHGDAVEATFREQWESLDNEDAKNLLLVAGQLPEAEALPNARLGLLAGVAVHGKAEEVQSPLDEALRQLEADSLVVELHRDQVRLHPLVREFAQQLIPPESQNAFRSACAQRMATAYENYETLEGMARERRGVTQLEEDLLTALGFCPTSDSSVQLRLRSLLRVLQRESHHLRNWDPVESPVLFPQQIRNRAFLLSVQPLVDGPKAWLAKRGQAQALLSWRVSRESRALVRTLTGHEGEVTTLAMTADGRILSASTDGTLKLWDLSTGQELKSLAGIAGGITALTAAKDGRIIIGTGLGNLQICDLATGNLDPMEGHGDWVTALEIAPDGRLVSSSRDGTIKQWNLSNGHEIRSKSSGPDLRLMSWGDGSGVPTSGDNLVIVGIDNNGLLHIRILDAGGNRVTDTDETKLPSTHAGAVSMLKKQLPDLLPPHVMTGAEKAQLIVKATSIVDQTLSSDGAGIMAMAIVPDGRVIAGSADGRLRVWELSSGHITMTLSGDSSLVTSLASAGSGQVISRSTDGNLRVWDLSTGKAKTLSGLAKGVTSLAMEGDCRIITGSTDGTLRVWHVSSGQEVRRLASHSDSVTAVSNIGQGHIVSSSKDHTLKIWDLSIDQESETQKGHGSGVSSLAVTGDNRVVTGATDGTLRAWNLSTGEQLGTHDIDGGWVRALVMVRDSDVAVGCQDGSVRVWDLSTGEMQDMFSAPGGVWTLATTGDGHVVSGSSDGVVRVWDSSSGLEMLTLPSLDGEVNALVATSDGYVVSGSSKGAVRVWDLSNREERWTRSAGGGSVRALALTPDGRVVSGSSDGTVKVWDVASGLVRQTFFRAGGAISALAAGDGIIISGSSDGAVRIWDLFGGSCLASLRFDSTPGALGVNKGSEGIALIVGEANGTVSCFRIVLPSGKQSDE
jgi:WD40 repeat protein